MQIETVSRAWFNPNQESKYYYVPSLIALMLFIFSLMLTSIGIVREKEIGTIEQVMVTPIRRIEFILGKTIPYMITGYITMTIMLCVAFVVFGVHVHGNLPFLYAVTGIYLVGNMGLALIISGSASTQQQALLTSFLVLMPCVMLSGFMFPLNNMPDPVRYATLFNPMRWYLEILRGIVMKDVGLTVLWPAIAAQTGLSLTFLILAASTIQKDTVMKTSLARFTMTRSIFFLLLLTCLPGPGLAEDSHAQDPHPGRGHRHRPAEQSVDQRSQGRTGRGSGGHPERACRFPPKGLNPVCLLASG